MILDPSQKEALYSDSEEDMRLAREQLDDLDVPNELMDTHKMLTSLLLNERDIWVHMVLYARTGQEIHFVLAKELLVNSEVEIQLAVQGLSKVLKRLLLRSPHQSLLECCPAPRHL